VKRDSIFVGELSEISQMDLSDSGLEQEAEKSQQQKRILKLSRVVSAATIGVMFSAVTIATTATMVSAHVVPAMTALTAGTALHWVRGIRWNTDPRLLK